MRARGTGGATRGSPLRIGVLGCADIAWRRMLPAIAGCPDTRLVAIASRDAAKAARFTGRFGGEPVVGYDRLLERPDVDAVYVPLPVALHAPWVERALRAGKHVLCEKPLTGTPQGTARLVALAAESGLALLENYMFLSHRRHALVRTLVADGAIGELRHLSAEFAVPPRDPADIRYRPELGGGALLDIAGYPVRTAQWYLGDELTVVGAWLNEAAGGVDVSGAALLAGPEGVTAQLTFGMDHVYGARYVLWGSTGRVTVPLAYTPPAAAGTSVVLEGRDGGRELVVPPDDQFTRTLLAFVARVREGVPSDLEGAPLVRQAELVDRIRRAAASAAVSASGRPARA
ncbi:Gfo/Idh/MocA family protein [Streptomyces sp. NPDC090021]|uniref:Gfo/Idh/MocA family protein n=1 Tax=Streptomyces sp. NPDC090021 TaxID=3365919 RepID=UPI0038156E29